MSRPRKPPSAKESAEASAAGSAETQAESHRGAFGDFGGESSAFIERTFRERILLVAVDLPPHDSEAVDASLDELALLVDTAGADEVGRVVQRRDSPDPATYVGRGKLEEIRQLAEATDCDTVVFDDELTPAQQRNLESALGRSAIDRTAVILDIFAQNAHSQEGRAQVQLALFRYRLPRLRGKGLSLSQQAGGIGARRGPGETQFEIDRRRIERQIHKLEADLERIGSQREVRAKSRSRSGIPHVVIVGYTNAGKSTLLNSVTAAEVLVQDKLFATLDATTRQLSLPGGESIVVTDTVGFVSKLPHQLVEAFRTTLDVVLEADLLVHVVDGAGPDPQGNIEAVHEVLAEIGGGELPELVVYNKADASEEPSRLARLNPPSVAVSARSGVGVDKLLSAVADRLRARMPTVTLEVPWDRGDVLASVHRGGEVLSEVPSEQHMVLTARLPEDLIARHSEFAVAGSVPTDPEA